jgi:phosphoribosylformimino-5-aminoimidazole carboxamide ribotide isomerase
VLIPCIDLQDGQAVQLVHGRKRELAVADIASLLRKFKRYDWLHIIDLDAAMRKSDNAELVRELCKTASESYRMKVRVGGGIRTASHAAKMIKCGARQIIIGSAAFKNGRVNGAFFRQLTEKVERTCIVVALDTAEGQILVKGWREQLQIGPADVIAELEPFCSAFLCTDVDREGTMSGANLEWFRRLREMTSQPIIAAGGIKTHGEINALEKIGMDAAVGMALYKGLIE